MKRSDDTSTFGITYNYWKGRLQYVYHKKTDQYPIETHLPTIDKRNKDRKPHIQT